MFLNSKLLNAEMNILKNAFKTYQFKRMSSHSQLETIYALSSGHGKCGVAVIRVSGPKTDVALKSLAGLETSPKPRYALLKSFKHPKSGELLDRGLLLWFPGPRSFTGEDCCEFHVHGGIAVVSAMLNALGTIPGLRLALPGEFTRRAFYNGKMDLTEVEGLADLLSAETEAQRKQALLQAQGFLSKIYNDWRNRLLRCLAHIEAHIDFDETESLESDLLTRVAKDVMQLCVEIQQHLLDGRKGERLRSGVRTVILGEPNVGKSSLLNALCRRPAAIVTPIEGTTRDVLDVTLDIGGYPVVLSDTAGLRHETEDVIEKEGINRALKSFEMADLILLVLDSKKYLSWVQTNPNQGAKEFLKLMLHKLKLNESNESFTKNFFDKNCLVIFNKTDLIQPSEQNILLRLKDIGFCISCKTEEGFEVMVSTLVGKLKDLCGDPSEHVSMNQARHKQHLTDCLDKLNVYLDDYQKHVDVVLLAEHLRLALRHLGKLTGAVTNEQLLDVVFRDFCIGK